MTTELGKAKQARRSLEKVRRRLLNPTIQALDASAVDLGHAIDCMKELEKVCAAGRGWPPGWRRTLELEITGLRQELKAVSVLAAGAGKFMEGWARLISSPVDDGPVNYTNRGVPAEVVPINSKRLVVHG